SLLGKQPGLFRSQARLHPGCRERFPRRDLCCPAELDRADVPQAHLLQQARKRRSLRGVGTTGTFHEGTSGCVRTVALQSSCEKPSQLNSDLRPHKSTNRKPTKKNMNTIEASKETKQTQLNKKVLYTAQTHTTGGRDGGVSRSSDGRLDIRLSV